MYSASRIRELMNTQGRRQDWLAQQTGYTVESVSRFLGGTQPISEEFAVRAAKSLGVPPHFLQESIAEAVPA